MVGNETSASPCARDGRTSREQLFRFLRLAKPLRDAVSAAAADARNG